MSNSHRHKGSRYQWEFFAFSIPLSMEDTLGGQVSSTDRNSVFVNSSINGPESAGSKVPPVAPTDGAPVCPVEPQRSPTHGRKRQPLGAGEHAAELG